MLMLLTGPRSMTPELTPDGIAWRDARTCASSPTGVIQTVAVPQGSMGITSTCVGVGWLRPYPSLEHSAPGGGSRYAMQCSVKVKVSVVVSLVGAVGDVGLKMLPEWPWPDRWLPFFFLVCRLVLALATCG